MNQQLESVETKLPSSNWFDLPFKMRRMIIDRMDPKTRCRFAQCSKMCKEEAEKSENYLYLIEMGKSRSEVLRLIIRYGGDNCCFCLDFMDADFKQTIVVYRCEKRRGYDEYQVAKWSKVELGEPTDVREKYAKEYLEKYKNSIRGVRFEDDCALLYEINLNVLPKLNELTIYRLPEGFKTVKRLETVFIDSGKLLRLKKLSIQHIKFTFDEIVKFEGKSLSGTSDDFDVKNTNKYLKMWKNGELPNIEYIELSIKIRGDISIKHVTDGLDVHNYEEDVNGIGVYCEFYCKSEVRGNKWFRATYQPLLELQVTWLDPDEVKKQNLDQN